MKKILLFLIFTATLFAQGVYIRNAHPNGLKVDEAGAIDVYLQDKTTKKFMACIARYNDTLRVLGADAVVDSYKLIIKSSTILANDYLSIVIDGNNPQYYCGKVVSVSDDSLYMDTPLNFPYDSGAVVREYFPEMNVNGSSTQQIFTIINRTTNPIDINKIAVSISDSEAMDDGKFGGVNALAKGVTLRVKRNTGYYEHLGTLKTNGDLAMYSDGLTYSAKAPAGQNGLFAQVIFNGQEHAGVTIRLDYLEELQFIVKDDLSGLTSFRAMAFGHFTQD